jgi:hypothetical protein
MATPKRPKRPRDPAELAHQVFQEAVGERPKAYDPRLVEPPDPVRQAAAELGRRGGLKGGKARATKLTSKQRSEAARKAALARWAKERKT